MDPQFLELVNQDGNLAGIQAKSMYPSRGSRAEFQKHFSEVEPNIREALRTKELHLGDQIIYSIKPLGGSKTLKMFETQDDKEVGLRNVSNGKLPKGTTMLVSGLFVLQGQAPAASSGSATVDEIKATTFGSIGATNLGALSNAEFELKANKKVIIPEISCRIFVTDNNTNWPLGFYKLHNPRMIPSDVLIEATFELGTTEGIPADTYVYLGLFGTVTTP
ncbi:MAG: hypothetical protein H6581_20615 [Bacteroidia bacterium]|nr:hypothetical protein [Bacteroidia bacterium]